MQQHPAQPPDSPTKITPPEEAEARLRQWGLSAENIRESVTFGDNARKRVDQPWYPRTYAGVAMWAETLAGLRRQLKKLQQGWQIGRTGNYETVYSEEKRLAFAVVAGDKYTGTRGKRHPKLTRKRGPKTRERVERNAEFVQPTLWGTVESVRSTSPQSAPLTPDEDCSTWFLVVYADDDEIRMEVSLARDIGDGLVDDWVERILIPPIPSSGAVAPIESDEDDDDDGESMVFRATS
ncbi:hypothetical protein [Streptomyces sp. IB201691-2A2]|uniref:hypothetical protein n=1 Tax=Streptomyces sp. IB201691-2A2 TaxID=2561920 RepID=UPI00117C86AC|nr:hypothetical protein [Streptomyces sp. IB201691-2A2]TRO57623.1 hypothetical protein E4K73_41690 [Streptomyces sp. IB201691-2A2]